MLNDMGSKTDGKIQKKTDLRKQIPSKVWRNYMQFREESLQKEEGFKSISVSGTFYKH